MGIIPQLRLPGGERGARPESRVQGTCGKPSSNPAEPPAARSRLCPGTLCFTALPVPAQPPQHPQPRTLRIVPGTVHCAPARGTPVAGISLPLGIAPEQRDGEGARSGPQAQRGPSDYFGAPLWGRGSWAARKRGAACPGTRRSYARNVHAHGWPPARPCRGTSPTSGLPAAPVTPSPAPGNGVGAAPRGTAAPGRRGASSPRRSQRLGRDPQHRSSWAEQGTAGDEELEPRVA